MQIWPFPIAVHFFVRDQQEYNAMQRADDDTRHALPNLLERDW